MNHIKAVIHILLVLTAFSTQAQNPRLEKIWETDSTLKVPESALYYATGKFLWVSNIDGKSNEKDLKGSISKVALDGKIITQEWAANLSAPKGMGIYNDMLYVADLGEVVVLDVKTAKVSKRIPINGAIALNDITIDQHGVVYVSDSETGKVHRIQNGTATTYLENKKRVNGLLSVKDDLYLVVKDTLFRADKNKKLFVVATGMDESGDGIVQNGNDFIVSCWNGVIYNIKPDGSKSMLLDTRDRKSNTADIGFDPVSKTLYVPTFSKNKVVAYHVN